MSLISDGGNGPHDASPPSSVSAPDTRRRLERRAEVVRSRLLRHIDALDDRRHQVQDLGRRAKVAGERFGAFAVGGALLLGGAIGLAVWALKRRSSKKLENRVASALAPLRRPRQPSLGADLGRRLLMTVIPVVVAQLSTRITKRALPTPKERLIEQRVHG